STHHAVLLNQPYCFLCAGSLQPHHDGHRNVPDFLIRVDPTLGPSVTAYNATADIDQDRFYVRILENDIKACLDRLCTSRSAYVKEVCRFTTRKLDNVHGRHGQASSVDHTAYVTVQLYVVQV